MKTFIYCFFIILFSYQSYSAEPLGKWSFNNQSNIESADIGNDLILVGSRTINFSNELNKNYVTVPVGSYYKCHHTIEPKNNEEDINEYSLLFDFRVPQSGQYYCFYQTNIANENDGEVFINPNMQIGITATGYSSKTVVPKEWYRLVISVKNGELFNYYLDGELILTGNAQDIDGRFSIEKDTLLFFADENAEDNDIDISQIQLFDKALSQAEVTALGKFEHKKYKEILPYLQAPTDSSVAICWHSDKVATSKVEIRQGADATLYVYDAEYVKQDENTYWYYAEIPYLKASTVTYYKCFSGDDTSSSYYFKTFPKSDTKSGHFRFILLSDCQSDFSAADRVTSAIKSKLTALYGNEYYNDVNLIFYTGDIVGNGNNLESYYTEFFKPNSKLSCNIPIMTTIGNHENAAEYYYNYMLNDKFAGPEGEKYYKFNYGPIKMYALNSPFAGVTQSQWFRDEVLNQQHNDSTMMIFTFLHYPSHSEIWPDGNSLWASGDIDPTIELSSKANLKANGHSHCYERGAMINGNCYTLTLGGAGGGLDRWGAYENQKNYPEVQKSLDVYHWILVDVNLQDSSYEAFTYSLGNADKSANNEFVDYFRFKKSGNCPTISYSEPSGSFVMPLNIKIQYPINYDSIYCSQLQISSDAYFSNILADTLLCKEDYYGNSGSPEFLPINLNNDVDLKNIIINSNFQSGTNYYYRIRYRNNTLNWSDYSDYKTIIPVISGIENTSERKVDYKISQDGTCHLSINSTDAEFSYTLCDILGREILSGNQNLKNGNNSIPFVISNSGVYILKYIIQSGDGVESSTIKIIK